MSAFFDHVRGISDELPPGYTEAGMRLYRHLTWLGVSQMLESRYPELRSQLDESVWKLLTEAFLKQSAWTSPHCQDIPNDFLDFLERTAASDA